MNNKVPAPFIDDIKTIDSMLNYDKNQYNVIDDKLYAAFLPYYVDPDTMKLTVVMKREIQAGAYIRTGRKMGISVMMTELPVETQLSIDDAFKTMDIDLKIQNAVPFGSIMTHPTNSSFAVEMVLVQIEPPIFLDEKRKIIKQEAGKFEVGSIPFDAILDAIHENFLQDMTSRLMLSELYIMAMEEANKQSQDDSQFYQKDTNKIGGGSNHASEFYENISKEDLPRTSNVSDEILNQNQKKDFGAIYSNI